MWGYLLYSGDISSVWALFGVSNQLMASIGLIIGATVVLKIADKRWYMLTCLVPLAYLLRNCKCSRLLDGEKCLLEYAKPRFQPT